MAPGLPPTIVTTSPPVRAKYRLRFRKDGDLRLVSHHDLMHCFERMLRRACLPFAVTQGFHPTPRLVFAQALALGVAGLNEVVELELTEALPADEVHRRLVEQSPSGLTFHDVAAVPSRTAARVRRACYRLEVSQPDEVADRCRELLAQESAWIERIRPRHRRFNLRPFISELDVRDGGVEMWLWVTSNGAARPEEVLRLLGLEGLLEDGAVIARVALELQDEVGPDAPPVPDLRLDEITAEPTTALSEEETGPTAIGATALISGPMSFET